MQVSQQTEQPAVSPVLPVDVDVMKEITRPTLSALKAFNGALAENCSSYQHEWLQFLGRRWHENASMPARFAACKSPVEMQGLWAEYWSRTFNQYSEEYQRLAHICQVSQPGAAEARTDEPAANPERGPQGPRPH